MKIRSYLTFNGNAAEAIEFYKDTLGAREVTVSRFSDIPPSPDYAVPEAAKNLILHAEIKIGEDVVFISDNEPNNPFNQAVSDNIAVTLIGMDAAMATELYNKLKVGGKEIMPIQETFWSSAYGMLVDKFGIKWFINADS